jgi:hypothetical protein
MHNIIVVLLGMLFLIRPARSQSAEKNVILPGHLHSEAEVLEESSDVAVAALVYKGHFDLGGPGVLNYYSATVRIERSIKGSAKGEVTCRYNRRDFPELVAEEEPVAGTRYIVFMKYRGQLDERNVYSILRFSAFSDKRVGEVEKMVQSSGVNP